MVAVIEVDQTEWAALREDVGYIKAHMETLIEGRGDHEGRLRVIERVLWGVPASLVLAVWATFKSRLHLT